MTSKETFLHFPAEHPVFSGHFPGKPMVPGVLLLDAALLAATAHQAQNPAGPVPRCQVTSAKFLSPVLPGETLSVCCTPTTGGQTRFDISAAGRQVATGTFTFGSST